jgi:hypothetical protein
MLELRIDDSRKIDKNKGMKTLPIPVDFTPASENTIQYAAGAV